MRMGALRARCTVSAAQAALLPLANSPQKIDLLRRGGCFWASCTKRPGRREGAGRPIAMEHGKGIPFRKNQRKEQGKFLGKKNYVLVLYFFPAVIILPAKGLGLPLRSLKGRRIWP